MRNLPDRLCIHLLIVDGARHVCLAGHLHTEIATGTRRVGQWLTVVRGGDERAQAGSHRILVRAHLSYLYVLLCEESLDLRLLTFRFGIILIDIHQPHPS